MFEYTTAGFKNQRRSKGMGPVFDKIMAAPAQGVGLIWDVRGEELFTHLPVNQGQRENA